MQRHWETDYKHGRRKHRHRCWICSRIINEGERVLMNRFGNRTTRAMHIEHADETTPEGMTMRELAIAHSGAK